MRLASTEKSVLGQFEVGLGAVPGGNPMARLGGLVGRGRALEVILVADDFPGPLAERYGYVNRTVPDDQLDRFVDEIARRVAGFEKPTLVEAKRFVDEVTLPHDSVFPPALDRFFASAARSATQARTKSLLVRGLQQRTDVEFRLGHHVAANYLESQPNG
jgi:enoyl-CoA hydratase/carnithine racemase